MDNCITFSLPKGYSTTVSLEDADLAKLKWRVLVVSSRAAYAQRTYTNESGKTIVVGLHRMILSRMMGRDLLSSEYTDHINNNTLDNRRENLRLATPAQNRMNSRKELRSGASQYKGVALTENRKRYMARIKIDKRTISLGTFDTDIEAAIAYNHAAKIYHGEFANFNEIPGWQSCLVPPPKTSFGPYWDNSKSRWRVVIIRGKTKHRGGQFKTYEEALDAYRILKRKLDETT